MERGHGAVTTTFTWVGSRFSDGELVPRHDVVAASGDLAYTVGTERGEVRIDGGEPFVMTLRVTHVLRRFDGEWWLVHRHADLPRATSAPTDVPPIHLRGRRPAMDEHEVRALRDRLRAMHEDHPGGPRGFTLTRLLRSRSDAEDLRAGATS